MGDFDDDSNSSSWSPLKTFAALTGAAAVGGAAAMKYGDKDRFQGMIDNVTGWGSKMWHGSSDAGSSSSDAGSSGNFSGAGSSSSDAGYSGAGSSNGSSNTQSKGWEDFKKQHALNRELSTLQKETLKKLKTPNIVQARIKKSLEEYYKKVALKPSNSRVCAKNNCDAKLDISKANTEYKELMRTSKDPDVLIEAAEQAKKKALDAVAKLARVTASHGHEDLKNIHVSVKHKEIIDEATKLLAKAQKTIKGITERSETISKDIQNNDKFKESTTKQFKEEALPKAMRKMHRLSKNLRNKELDEDELLEKAAALEKQALKVMKLQKSNEAVNIFDKARKVRLEHILKKHH